MSFRLRILSTFSLVLLAIFITPTEALAQAILPVSRGGTGTGSFTIGSLLFYNGSTITEDNSNLFWDDTNNRLGIGTSSPTSTLEVSGNAKVTSLTSTADSIINTLNIGLGGGSVATNTSIGKGALNSNSNGGDNTAVGFIALGTSTHSGEQNTAVGSQSLSSNTSGSFNAGFGYQALWQNTSGIRNVAVGFEALHDGTTVSDNNAIGFRSLLKTTSGGGNIAIGYNSFLENLTGSNNIVLGWNAAAVQADGSTHLTTANDSIYMGKSVRGFGNSDSNSIVIGADAIGAGANKTVIGNSSMTDVYFGSSAGVANTHAKKMFLGSSTSPGCIVMGDSDGSGVTYLTVNDGVLTTSSTQPSACQ